MNFIITNTELVAALIFLISAYLLYVRNFKKKQPKEYVTISEKLPAEFDVKINQLRKEATDLNKINWEKISGQKMIDPNFGMLMTPIETKLKGEAHFVPICHSCMHRLKKEHPPELIQFPQICGLCFEHTANGTVMYFADGLINSIESAEEEELNSMNKVKLYPGLDELLAPVAQEIEKIRMGGGN